MKLAEDGDDWGMQVPGVVFLVHRFVWLNQCSDARLDEDELWKLRMQGL
jgi:hypothetical protein